MKSIRFIRKTVFGINQGALAQIAGTTQTTVSRWERGELEPSHRELSRIRDHAISAGLAWNDAWFFEDPPNEVAA